MTAKPVGIAGVGTPRFGSVTGVAGPHGATWAVEKPGPANYGPQLPSGFRNLIPKPIPRPPKRADREVIGQATLDRPRRTLVKITVVAHASPRWIGAASAGKADELNQKLSGDRELAVRRVLETELKAALPDQQLEFEYQMGPWVPNPSNPLDARAPVDVDSKAVGSTETLKEAGKAGRAANEASMRRVDIAIKLESAIDTDQVTTVNERQQVSNATRSWSIKIGMTMQVEFDAGAGTFNFTLRNRLSGQEVDGWAAYFVVGPGVSLPIPTIDFGWNDFETEQNVTFKDFEDGDIGVAASGFNALLFGYEWSALSITGTHGASATVDTSGFVMGGAGITLYEGKTGIMHLRSAPETYAARVVHDEQRFGTSRITDLERHTVQFDTGSSIVAFDQDHALRDFVRAAARKYQRPGTYVAP